MQDRPGFFHQISEWLKIMPWYESWRRAFWRHPDLLLAARATLVMALVVIPLEIMGYSFFAVTMALGVLAGALSETDDHPRGRIKALLIKVIAFALSSLSVEILRPWPIWLGVGLAISTVFFILVGGIGERYRGVTFGAVLVGIYAMIGTEISPAWYWQPALLSGGALVYGLISLVLLLIHPWRLLHEQLGRGYYALARYMDEKSRLFPSDEKMQETIRARLALLNVEVVTSLERIKELLNRYRDEMTDEKQLEPYFYYFMVLQGLHERAASSHERYDLLSQDPDNREIVEMTGQTLHELGHAARRFAGSILTATKFQCPASLKWMVNLLSDRLATLHLTKTHPFTLLATNLIHAGSSFLKLENPPRESVLPRLSRDISSLWDRFRSQLSLAHPRMRYAIRLALCFVGGFAISEMFEIDKGEWIVLTVLFVLQPTYSATRRRLYQRVLGTLTGVVAGVLVVKLLTLPGQVMLMLASAFFFFAWLKRQYSVSVVFITIFVLCAFNLIAGKGVAVMVPRLLDTLIGAFLALGTVRVLWPQWQYKKLPQLLGSALEKNTAYLKEVLQEYEKTSSDDLEYRIARREAHQADNALALAWQDMQMEPSKFRHFRQQAFRLTYLNHALLSFISAFGAHRGGTQRANEDVLKTGQQILDVLGSPDRSTKERREAYSLIVYDLREKIQMGWPEGVHQQFVLLFNIADTGRQLAQEATTFPDLKH
ncbi:MAG: YccS family putative transporter [Marinilabiliaceae bacterium]